MIKRLLTFILLLLSAHQVIAGPCVLDQSACLDATPCKTIAGENICLADIGETCWKYKDDYTCVKVGAEQQCEPLMDASTGCFQINSTCIATDPDDGSCFTHEMLWQCPDWTMTTPPDVIRLDDTINYVKNALNESTCGGSSTCTTVSQTCIEGPETRTISGIDVYKDCWKWNREYTCPSANSADCIVNESDPTCALTSTVCTSLNPDNSCALYSKTYTCSSGTIDTAAANAQCEGGGAPCTTQTVTLPPETRTEACQETMDANPETCDRTRDVQVDKDYLYSCKSSNNQVNVEKCLKTLSVEVNVFRCTPGELLYDGSAGELNWFRLHCGAAPGAVDVSANYHAWSAPGNSTTYIHQARLQVDDAGNVSISQYGYKRAYEQSVCNVVNCVNFDDEGNCLDDLSPYSCTNVRICSGASCPPLQCHPPTGCADWTSGIGVAGWTDPISYLDQTKVMFMSYARRGGATTLESSSCDTNTGMCVFNFLQTTEYNWDDSAFSDRFYPFQATNVYATKRVETTDTWIDQCVALEARTQ